MSKGRRPDRRPRGESTYRPFAEGLDSLRKKFGHETGQIKPAAPRESFDRPLLRVPTKITLPLLQSRLSRNEIQFTGACIIQNLLNKGHISIEQANALAANFNLATSGRNFHRFVGEQITLEELLKLEKAQ